MVPATAELRRVQAMVRHARNELFLPMVGIVSLLSAGLNQGFQVRLFDF
jgi:hypothetical protein